VDPHVANPFRGATGYVDPQWRAAAEGEPGGSRVSGNPTGIWLDAIADIEGRDGRMGLREHLDAALAQGAGYVQVVLHDLPDRDCTLATATGELGPDELTRYQRLFVDPIVAIESDPRYAALRIVNVVEPNALAELVIGRTSFHPRCLAAAQNGTYVRGIQYVLDQLHRFPNLYAYLGASHHGQLGWDDNFAAAATLLATTVRGTAAGAASVDGIITNTADYGALAEPFFDTTTTVLGTTVRQSRFVDWNRYVGELAFAQALRTALVAQGLDEGLGVLIDTSRNGWGGPARPTRVSTSTDVNTFVDQSRIDRRVTIANWCNQVGAGLGERPRPDPAPGVDAYVWMRPPGLSDGSSTWVPGGGDAPDPRCDPRYDAGTAMPRPTGAMPDAPPAGAWFPAAFRELMANAHPPLP
jgi:cellulose 1,4-beta-cellobiosidase